MKNYFSAIIFGIATVISAIFLGKSYVERSQVKGTIEVTGLGKVDFTSDLIVWEGNFSTNDFDLKEAFSKLKRDKEIIKTYLKEKGLSDEQIVFSAVNTNKKYTRKYSNNGDYMGEEFAGYELSQTVKIESEEVAKIETISREVTELLNQRSAILFASPTLLLY